MARLVETNNERKVVQHPIPLDQNRRK